MPRELRHGIRSMPSFHRGSGARFIRTTCCDCGELLSNVERHPPTEFAATCPHRNTDHRGSNKWTVKTFCKDCGTVIEEVPRQLATEHGPSLSTEEQVLVDTVNEHATINLEQVVQAAELMASESRRLAPEAITHSCPLQRCSSTAPTA